MVILLSIYEEYVKSIRDGKKRYEFRKRYPLNKETLALIYVPRPVKAITSWALFGKPITGGVRKMLELKSPKTYDEKLSLIKYFEANKKCYALPILKFGDLQPPIFLNEMANYNIKPPQHIIYLHKHQQLLELAASRSPEFSDLLSKTLRNHYNSSSFSFNSEVKHVRNSI
ncbi:hypothetical protein DRN75_02800 [Nanoarchaeota archaeon]|nr:MAG: hypothetical protein DRN75_02800 [Nanoarchaeota archaeon]